MIKINEIETWGFKGAVRGMRNPFNSWAKSDSTFPTGGPAIGDNDLKLMTNLASAGDDHGKFLRMIHVQMDIIAPLYWWKEYDTYKVGTTANSCSTMHTLLDRPFDILDFAVLSSEGMEYMMQWIAILNGLRDDYIMAKEKGKTEEAYLVWKTIIQLLPESYNQRRTVDLDYQTLIHMYNARKGHKLTEWEAFRKTIYEYLPYFDIFVEKP